MRKWALALAALVAVVMIAATSSTNVVIPDLCKSLDPDGWTYYLLGCSPKDSAGGGGSGAS